MRCAHYAVLVAEILALNSSHETSFAVFEITKLTIHLILYTIVCMARWIHQKMIIRTLQKFKIPECEIILIVSSSIGQEGMVRRVASPD